MSLFSHRNDKQIEKQIRAIRASRRYHRAILVNRLALAGFLGWILVLIGGPERAAGPYFIGLLVLSIVGTVMLALAGFPIFSRNRRVRSVLMRDMYDVGWWSGPPPPR